LRAPEKAAPVPSRGVKMDRKLKLTAHQQREALKRRDRGEPVREIARSYNVSHSTILRLTARGKGTFRGLYARRRFTSAA